MPVRRTMGKPRNDDENAFVDEKLDPSSIFFTPPEVFEAIREPDPAKAAAILNAAAEERERCPVLPPKRISIGIGIVWEPVPEGALSAMEFEQRLRNIKMDLTALGCQVGITVTEGSTTREL